MNTMISNNKTLERSPFCELLHTHNTDGSVTVHRDCYYLLHELYHDSSLAAQKIKQSSSVDPSLPDDVLFDKLSSRYLSQPADAYQYHKKIRLEMQQEDNYRKAVESLKKQEQQSSSNSSSDEQSED